MNNLVKDLIKLDLNKFNKQPPTSITQKNSPINYNVYKPLLAPNSSDV